MMRKLTITVIASAGIGHDGKEHTYADEYSQVFLGSEISDSQALHHLLCVLQPGEVYSVAFGPTDQLWPTDELSYDYERREV
jgi:hypothetical protein